MRNAVRTVIYVAFRTTLRTCTRIPAKGRMYHLFRGLHEYLTRKDEFSIVIIGLDNVSAPLFFRVNQADVVHRQERRSVQLPES